MILHSVLVNSERIRRQPNWLKQPTSCSTPLNRITCGTTLLAGSKSAAGVCKCLQFKGAIVSCEGAHTFENKHNYGFVLGGQWTAALVDHGMLGV